MSIDFQVIGGPGLGVVLWTSRSPFSSNSLQQGLPAALPLLNRLTRRPLDMNSLIKLNLHVTIIVMISRIDDRLCTCKTLVPLSVLRFFTHRIAPKIIGRFLSDRN